jgi:hypothetical protein
MGRKEVRGFDSRPPPLHLTCVNGASERNSVQTPGCSGTRAGCSILRSRDHCSLRARDCSIRSRCPSSRPKLFSPKQVGPPGPYLVTSPAFATHSTLSARTDRAGGQPSDRQACRFQDARTPSTWRPDRPQMNPTADVGNRTMSRGQIRSIELAQFGPSWNNPGDPH